MASTHDPIPSQGQTLALKQPEKKQKTNRRRRGHSRGQNTRAKASQIITAMATTHTNKVASSLGLVTTVESRPRPPLTRLPSPPVSVTVPLITLAKTETRAGQAPSAPAPDKPTAVRHVPRVRRQHCRGKKSQFHMISVQGSSSARRRPVSTAASPAGFSPGTSSRIPGRRRQPHLLPCRTHGLLRHLLQSFKALRRRREPAL